MKKITVIMVLVMLLTSLFAFGSSAIVYSVDNNWNMNNAYIKEDEQFDIDYITMRYNPDTWYTIGSRASTQVTATGNESGYAHVYIRGDNGFENETAETFSKGETFADTGIIYATGSAHAITVVHKIRHYVSDSQDTCWHYVYHHSTDN